jgi:FkbM family methyltransferase
MASSATGARLALGRLAARIAARLDPDRETCFAQEGEDRVLLRLLDTHPAGFYVDVGAHHPSRFSNTRLFYDRGWRGINIEPSPEAIDAFRSVRQRDINLQCGVAEAAGNLTYYVFDDPALNTFDAALMRAREARTPYRVVRTSSVAVKRLDSILRTYLPAGQAIDFMSIDVEGFDLQVLRSNDWSTYRPGFVLAEAHDFNLETPESDPVNRFMREQRYRLVAKTLNTLFYRDLR